MANINVGESEFELVAMAAMRAMQVGEAETARSLDKLARKINAALSNASVPKTSMSGMPSAVKLSWRDVPSTLPAPAGTESEKPEEEEA